MELKVKMISNIDHEAFEKRVAEFIEQHEVTNIQYSTEIESSKIVKNGFANVDTVRNTIRHYALIQYKDGKKKITE